MTRVISRARKSIVSTSFLSTTFREAGGARGADRFRRCAQRTHEAQKMNSRLTLSRRWIDWIASANRPATLMTLQQGARGSKR